MIFNRFIFFPFIPIFLAKNKKKNKYLLQKFAPTHPTCNFTLLTRKREIYVIFFLIKLQTVRSVHHKATPVLFVPGPTSYPDSAAGKFCYSHPPGAALVLHSPHPGVISTNQQLIQLLSRPWPRGIRRPDSVGIETVKN